MEEHSELEQEVHILSQSLKDMHIKFEHLKSDFQDMQVWHYSVCFLKRKPKNFPAFYPHIYFTNEYQSYDIL